MKAINNQKGFSAVEAVLIFVVVAILGFTGWFVLQRSAKSKDETKIVPKNSTLDLSSQDQSKYSVGLYTEGKFSGAHGNSQESIIYYETEAHPKCVSSTDFDTAHFIDDKQAPYDPFTVDADPSEGFAILYDKYCGSRAQLFAQLPSDKVPAGENGDILQFIADTDNLFKCSDLKTSYVPAGVGIEDKCLDMTGHTVTRHS